MIGRIAVQVVIDPQVELLPKRVYSAMCERELEMAWGPLHAGLFSGSVPRGLVATVEDGRMVVRWRPLAELLLLHVLAIALSVGDTAKKSKQIAEAIELAGYAV